MNNKKIKKIKNFLIFFFFILVLISLFFLKNIIFFNKKNEIDFITYKNYTDYASKKNLKSFYLKNKGMFKYFSLLKYLKKNLKNNDITFILKNFKNNKYLTKNNLINNILYFRMFRIYSNMKKNNLSIYYLNQMKDYPWIDFSMSYKNKILKKIKNEKK
ncbi:MAG: hypothetical protein G8D26_01910 [Buchnera aphidicola (Periphyllus acericola)]|uniref:hypothetical protein n=1 Tax=Buchnera aphidicola TaxID=9 RepID=UPI0030CDB90C|nr:hypothetical protein [Buchnera aphidicola (Periphyllus acericola)]